MAVLQLLTCRWSDRQNVFIKSLWVHVQ